MTTEHFLPWVSWHSEALAFFAVCVTALAALALRAHDGNKNALAVPRLAMPFLLFAALACIQAASGVMTFTGDALVVCFYMALCVACQTIGFNTGQVAADAQPEARAKWMPLDLLAAAFVVGGLSSTVVAAAQVFDLWETSSWIVRMMDARRPGANLGQPNQLATLLVMAVASAAFLHAAGKLGARAALVVILALLAGLAISESRSGALALAVLLLWWQSKRAAIAPRTAIWVGPALALGFLAMFFAWPRLLNGMELLGGHAANRFTQGDVRIAMWSQLAEAILQRPWGGWGILEVTEAHNAVAHASRVNNPLTYSHNIVLDWAVWTGVPIALALTVGSLYWLSSRLRSTRGLVPWYCLAVVLTLCSHSMVEFPFAYAYFLAPVMFMLGAIERWFGARPLMRIGSRTAFVLTLAFGGALLWSAAEYLAIEEDFRVVRFEQLRIGNTQAAHEVPNVFLLTQLGALLHASRVELAAAMPAANLKLLREAALRYPWVATQYRYAIALALNGNREEAVRQFQILRWQRGEKIYAQVKKEVAQLAQKSHPELLAFTLP